MVVWKGKIRPKHGSKAYNLDQTDLEVPNFFVITSEEVKNIFQTQNPERVLNMSLDLEEIRDAYKEVGMSSEVRKASSKARSLVGGQRDNSRVSIRVSENTICDSELDVGASGLENALKNVFSSYLREEGQGFPNILVQKMIEPEYTGAVVKGEKDYVEVVEGLGVSLEQGRTVPSMYLIDNGRVVEERVPKIQLKITRNPMTGDYRERRLKNPDKPFENSDIEKLASKSDNSFKFVYKRGSFYIVDVFDLRNRLKSLDRLQVSSGKIEGIVGKSIGFSDETLSPDKYDSALIALKGGYTSNDAYRARDQGKPAIFSAVEVEEGDRIGDLDAEDNGSELLGLSAATPVISISQAESEFNSSSKYIDSYKDVFAFEEGNAVLDARLMGYDGLIPALEYLEGEVVVLMDEPSEEVLMEVVRQGFSLGVPREKIGVFQQALGVVEKRFILEKLRHLSE